MSGLSARARAPQLGDVLRWGPEGWEPSAQQREWNRIHVHTETRTRVVMGAWQSPDFETGVAGWRFSKDGSLEANDITARGTVYATAGEIGGWTLAAGYLDSSGVRLDAANKAIYLGGTAWEGTGIQLEYNAGTPRMYVGNGADKYLRWDGAVLTLSGAVVTGIQTGSELGIHFQYPRTDRTLCN